MEEDIMCEEAFKEVMDNLENINNLTLYGRRNIKYYFNKLLEENKQQADIIKNSVSKDKIIEVIEKLNIDIERNKRRKVNNTKEGYLQMTTIAYDPEIVKFRLLRLIEGDE